MQTIGKRTKSGTKNCSSDIEALQSRKVFKSRSSTSDSSKTVFRNHFLNNSLTVKSGYLFSNYEDKVKLAKYWLKAIKKHEGYIPMQIANGSTIHDVLSELHKETDRIFKGFDWVLRYETETTPELKIYYYESLGDIGMHNLPIKWFAEHKNSAFRTIGLTLIKNIAHSFNISLFTNDIFEMVLDNGIKEGKFNEEYLKTQLIEWYGFDEENDADDLEAVISDFKNYLTGDIFKLRKEIDTIELNKFDFKELLKLIPLEQVEWLAEGRKLLYNTVDIDCFDFVPYDISRDNGDPVTIHQAIFFPYSFDDKPMEHYEQWVSDISNSTGINDMFKYGFLTNKLHVKPTEEKPLLALIEWLDKGRDLYFKETEQ